MERADCVNLQILDTETMKDDRGQINRFVLTGGFYLVCDVYK